MPPHFDRAVVREVGARHDLRIFDHTAVLEPQFREIDVVVDLGGSVGTREMLHAARSAKLWQVLGMGLDHFDLQYWKSQGMPVANCPGPLSAVALAESALMFMLMLARNYPLASANAHRERWYEPFGLELHGRTLGLVGFGASARELALRARAFGMRIQAVDLNPVSDLEAASYGIQSVGSPSHLDEMVPQVDFISLHLPLDANTRHIMDARRLSLLAPSACVINVARGALIDEDALVQALRQGKIAGAGLDVFSNEPLDPTAELLGLPNVVITPHIAGGTDGTALRRASLAAENCDRIAHGMEPLHRVA